MPEDEKALREKLLYMDPFDFELHVMNFFKECGLPAWVTKRSNDHGIDGFAKHPEGLIIVQCKRYTENPIGPGVVREFKGVLEENEVWRGYIVTTSYFTDGAKDSASKNRKIFLKDIESLTKWHYEGFSA
ncbi:Restriction endonuclease domain-containing protein [Desulfonema magnum]|uniref:Restriction endonuclease domain-containing protein n=2 Tax=Desulfonema magnum TaxID=45655 RepID=A0A975GKP7_9BACT|nr:Restriction endonuclease domain-containing protein [Desulfonema magnum]